MIWQLGTWRRLWKCLRPNRPFRPSLYNWLLLLYNCAVESHPETLITYLVEHAGHIRRKTYWSARADPCGGCHTGVVLPELYKTCQELPGLPFSDFSVTVPSSWSGAKASCTIREERSAEGAGNRMQGGWKSHVLTILLWQGAVWLLLVWKSVTYSRWFFNHRRGLWRLGAREWFECKDNVNCLVPMSIRGGQYCKGW